MRAFVAGRYVEISISPQPLTKSESLEGHYEETQQTVFVDSRLCLERQRAVLLHELLHAMLDLGGKPLTHDEEEKTVRVLENTLFQFLRDDRNNEVLNFILGGCGRG